MFKLAAVQPSQKVDYEDIDLTLGPVPEDNTVYPLSTASGTVEFSSVEGTLELCETEEEYKEYQFAERLKKNPSIKLCDMKKR